MEYKNEYMVKTSAGERLKTWMKRNLTIIFAKLLRRVSRPSQSGTFAVELHITVDEWLSDLQRQKDELLIGFVRCRNCGSVWEALAYSSSLRCLECPSCHAQESEPAHTGSKDREKW